MEKEEITRKRRSSRRIDRTVIHGSLLKLRISKLFFNSKVFSIYLTILSHNRLLLDESEQGSHSVVTDVNINICESIIILKVPCPLF